MGIGNPIKHSRSRWLNFDSYRLGIFHFQWGGSE